MHQNSRASRTVQHLKAALAMHSAPHPTAPDLNQKPNSTRLGINAALPERQEAVVERQVDESCGRRERSGGHLPAIAVAAQHE